MTWLTFTLNPRHHPGMDRRRLLVTPLAGASTAPLVGEVQQGGGSCGLAVWPEARYRQLRICCTALARAIE